MTSLRLGHKLESLHPSLTNGPGWRVAVWTQGCSLLCTDRCLNPHFLSPKGGFVFQTAEVAERITCIRAERADLEGVTILGGEPTDQVDGVVELLETLRAVGLSTMVYTGHVHDELLRHASFAMHRLLAATDILVDGPFLPDQYDSRLAWRGSRNQRLLCLTGRYDLDALEARFGSQGKGFSIQILPTGLTSVSGLQARGNAHKLEIQLASQFRVIRNI